MDLKWLGKIAPTIATALGGPLAGMAVEAVGKAMGIDNPTPQAVEKVLSDGGLSSEQIAMLQKAEIELKMKEKELGLDFEKLSVDDRKSAREMQVSIKSWVPATLAMVTTIGFFGILTSMLFGYFGKESPALMIMLGSLGTAWTGIIAFYFGSSASSQNKDVLLHRSKPSD